ncbi:MAG TPA: hypothetical protein GX734_06305 [Clostridiaceae bacterium]|nr:hypothetical protein [Clostridiaceae bacterium]
MKAEVFSDAMDVIDNKYIEEAVHYHREKKSLPWSKIGAVAAACIVLAGAFVIYGLNKQDQQKIHEPINKSAVPSPPQEYHAIRPTSSQGEDSLVITPTPPQEQMHEDGCLAEDAPIYTSIDQLVADSDYVFKGTLDRFEEAWGRADDTFDLWHWAVFKVDRHYKRTDAPDVIRMVARIHDPKYQLGEQYYVFADVHDSNCYPYPLVTPFYNLAIFKVAGNKVHIFDSHSYRAGEKDDIYVYDSTSGISVQDVMPAVYDEFFRNNPEKAILSSTEGLSTVREIPFVQERYNSLSDMLSASDCVVRVVFKETEKMNKYVTLGSVKDIESIYRADNKYKGIPLPTTIFFNETVQLVTVRPGETYYIFLRADQEGASYRLAAKIGAIISSKDEDLCEELADLLR